ncbi:serine protease persephone-like [Wyeomyia smithii]|uniref:serine protease persephone-like n=1 Tax=Wyeomyia smithii TaxID=174621 RepID=UPI002467D0EA|nr:serine protease persephone-like [Wyeomyia smithii]
MLSIVTIHFSPKVLYRWNGTEVIQRRRSFRRQGRHWKRRPFAKGDSCELRNGRSGLCVEAPKCSWFMETIAKKKKYNERVVCGFDGKTEVICCPPDASIAQSIALKPGVRTRLACDQVPRIESRSTFHIINGFQADDGEFPFMAALGYEIEDEGKGYEYRCGASLISDSFLLTAAHCIPKNSRPVVALLGALSLEPNNAGVLVRFKEFYPHPEYRSSRSYNDIGLIELEHKVQNEPNVNPICLYSGTEDLPDNVILSAEGFGIPKKGDPCQLRNGSSGFCLEAPKCPWFVETVLKKKKYNERVNCGFDGVIEVICCPSDSAIIHTIDLKPGIRTRLACDQVPQITDRLTFHIIDGTLAEEGEFPFMAALGYESEDVSKGYDYRCGASLITDTFVLTAAHCIPKNSRPTVVLLGTIKLDSGVVVRIKEFYPHPEYRSSRSYNDIALIELEKKVVNEEYVVPICLYSDTADLPENLVMSAEGFGITDVDHQTRSAELMKVNVTTVALNKCNQTFFENNLLTNNRRLALGLIETQYCATGFENTESKRIGDTCQGDSGGPLQIVEDNKFKLVGVTSFGNGCGSNTPSVYTRVARYIDWIESVVWPKPTP